MVQAPYQQPTAEQYFVYSAITWEEFKTLQAVLAPRGVRVAYLEGEVELLTVSDWHGLIAGNLGYLLEMYMLQQLIRFIGLEDFSIEMPAMASAQADKAYCFEQRKTIPDLTVEVVITGERESKLRGYAALQVAEVWFWMEGEIRIYRLDSTTGQYRQAARSVWLPELDCPKLAGAATQEFRADAVAAFMD